MGFASKLGTGVMAAMTFIIAGSLFQCVKSCAQKTFSPKTNNYTETAPSHNFANKPNTTRAVSTTSLAAPTGEFTIDLKSSTTYDKSFVFNIKERDDFDKIKMSVKETGTQDNKINALIRFNVVYWDPATPNKGGLKFQLIFNPARGCFVRDANPNLKTLYIAKGERAFVDRISPDGSFKFSADLPNLKKTQTLNRYELTLPNDQPVTIEQSLIEYHKRAGKPAERNPISVSRNNGR